ncbi:hypothetical protein AVL55_03780 [Alteromonas macleodii]|uniref:TnsA endonuclease N-terminal domain-containing protein n=2 Tax=Alteromonas TaxID=226 RepID=A0A126PYP6_ALTMA|nr:TnsA endonuclease N-terminal domain-containing protein [Alteromonas macleodii]AMJ97358.1 hypothetical protein AVL55_03780 [Alteromonas macleodii]
MKNANSPKIKQPTVTELTENKIDDYLTRREFEGKYIPYKTARQFSSMGNASTEQLAQETQRHEYFSDMERHFGLTLSYLKNVSKVKTQYPLIDVDTTLAVATRLNIAHPRFAPKSGLVKDANQGYQASIMTTDFCFQYVDIMTGETKKIAVSLKYNDEVLIVDSGDAVTGRTQDKLKIEQAYWEDEKQQEYRLITSSHWTLSPNLVKNLAIARRHRNLDVPHIILKSFQVHFLEFLTGRKRHRLADLVFLVSKKMSISFEKTYGVFWYLIWHKGLQVDLFRPLADASFVFNAKEDYAWEW